MSQKSQQLADFACSLFFLVKKLGSANEDYNGGLSENWPDLGLKAGGREN